jgi:hypothetical protein
LKCVCRASIDSHFSIACECVRSERVLITKRRLNIDSGLVFDAAVLSEDVCNIRSEEFEHFIATTWFRGGEADSGLVRQGFMALRVLTRSFCWTRATVVVAGVALDIKHQVAEIRILGPGETPGYLTLLGHTLPLILPGQPLL